MKRIEFNKSKHQGKEAFFLQARLGGLSSKETLLVDTGADYLTVSDAIAEQMDLDLRNELNPELAIEYHDLKDEEFDNFFRNKWIEADKKAINTHTDTAVGTVGSTLYPVEVEFENDIVLQIPVNFLQGDVSISMLGRRGLYIYCDKMVVKTGEGSGYFEVKEKWC
jgi:hypothetical protein